MALQLDLDRYDHLADFEIFSVTWCLWDYCEFSCVYVFSFLSTGDLRAFCCATYCIRVDYQDIEEELERFRLHLENHGR